MAERIVDVLEMVDVDEKHGAQCGVATRTGDCANHGRIQRTPVREPGQRVRQRLRPHFFVTARVGHGDGALVGKELDGLNVGAIGDQSVHRLVN